jgi:hypothetical protein
VEIQVHEMLELGFGGRKQLLGGFDVPIHRAADVEK